MATATVNRPYVRYTPEMRRNIITKVGFDQTYDIRIRLEGAAWPDIVCQVSWAQEKTLVGRTTATETKITNAAVTVYQVGLGWGKISEPAGDTMRVNWSERVIHFRKRFLLEVSVNPVLKAIPLIGEADVMNRWLVEIHGVLDVISKVHTVEMVYP